MKINYTVILTGTMTKSVFTYYLPDTVTLLYDVCYEVVCFSQWHILTLYSGLADWLDLTVHYETTKKCGYTMFRQVYSSTFSSFSVAMTVTLCKEISNSADNHFFVRGSFGIFKKVHVYGKGVVAVYYVLRPQEGMLCQNWPVWYGSWLMTI